jgi:hypothetical protein
MSATLVCSGRAGFLNAFAFAARAAQRLVLMLDIEHTDCNAPHTMCGTERTEVDAALVH